MKLVLFMALCALCALVARANSAPQPSPAPDTSDVLGVDDCDLSNTNHTAALFQRYQKKHGISFSGTNATHYNKAFQHFHASATKIQKNRAAFLAGNSTYLLGFTKFAHMSFEEFQAGMLGRLPDNAGSVNVTDHGRARRQIPASGALNWATRGYVTPVKNQGQCGCCWSFASTGCVEGAYARKKGTLVSFSEQQLIECVGTASAGCNGGKEVDAFQYIQRNGGLDTEASYPYTSANNRYSACSSTRAGRVKQTFGLSYARVAATDAALYTALVNSGPVDVAIGVAPAFQLYRSGILTPTACLPTGQINHSVLLVGYSRGAAGNYWIVKNSWGTTWGEAGYFRLSMNYVNVCSITKQANTCTVS